MTSLDYSTMASKMTKSKPEIPDFKSGVPWTPELLTPNVQDLQTDVIDLLKQTSSLMDCASTALSSDSAGNKYGEFQQEVIEAAHHVEKLELMMSIVAPMKAGKSTIVNAIVGQEILPSRNAAMTTLPTEIVFSADLSEPTLALNAEILSVFQETLLTLQNKIERTGMDWAREKLSQHPHLMELLEQIQSGFLSFVTRAKTVGREEIIKTLTDLNDVIRLCSLIEPSVDPLRSLIDVPQIQTPFWRSPGSAQPERMGNLVIVDTPGPNEAGENLRLASVVAEQLRKSSIILIVLDFTQLKTKAAEEIKKDVQKVIDLRGKENLYVLVNKVDQRTESDMTPEQVKQFVAAEFGIGNDNTNRVFEVAARWAFSATNFLLELQQHPNTDIAEMKTVRALAQQALGARWEAKLKRASVEDLQGEAEYLWQESGFAPFLEKAIKALMESAAPRCMRSALNLSRSRLVELRDDVELRSSAIAQDAEKLQHEVGALEADLHHLELCRSRLQAVDSVKTNLHQKLSDILEDLKNAAKVTLETYFSQEEYQRADWLKQKDIEARQWLLTPLGDFEFFPKWISKRLTTALEFKSSGLSEFNSEQEAEEFANQAITYAKQRADSLISSVREQTAQEVELARTGLISFLDRETKPIIERARTRLNEAFDVNLSLPQLSWESSDGMEMVKPRVSKQHRYLDQGYATLVKKKREWWHWLWLMPVEVPEKVKRPDRKLDYYTVSIEELVTQINQSIETSIEGINQGINNYLDEDFQQRVDAFFESLDSYLRNYRDSLRQAQVDQKLSLDEKAKLVGGLSSLVPEANAQIEKAETYLEHTDCLLEVHSFLERLEKL